MPTIRMMWVFGWPTGTQFFNVLLFVLPINGNFTCTIDRPELLLFFGPSLPVTCFSFCLPCFAYMSLRVNGSSLRGCRVLFSGLYRQVSSSFYSAVAPGLPLGELLYFTLDTASDDSLTILLSGSHWDRCLSRVGLEDLSAGVVALCSVPASFDLFEHYLPSGMFLLLGFGACLCGR
jgi:hypothetical protein